MRNFDYFSDDTFKALLIGRKVSSWLFRKKFKDRFLRFKSRVQSKLSTRLRTGQLDARSDAITTPLECAFARGREMHFKRFFLKKAFSCVGRGYF